MFDSSVTVSLYPTTGSLTFIGHLAYLSKSFIATLTCSSPHPHNTTSPFSSIITYSKGSPFDKFLTPSVNFGKS